MVIICVGTDLFPAMTLVHERPEGDLLAVPPRDPKKDRLADWRLLLHAYGFIGILESLTSMVAAYYFCFQRRFGIPFSALCLSACSRASSYGIKNELWKSSLRTQLGSGLESMFCDLR